MEDKKSSVEVIDAVKQFFQQLPDLSYGTNALQYFNQPDYGSGIAGYNQLRSDLEELDLSKSGEFVDLDKKIRRLKKEVNELESKNTNLISILGEKTNGAEGYLANQILTSLKNEIDDLIDTRNKLRDEISQTEDLEERRIAAQIEKESSQQLAFEQKTKDLEEEFKKLGEDLKKQYEIDKSQNDNKIKLETEAANQKIEDAISNAQLRVKLINQFRDFLEETVLAP